MCGINGHQISDQAIDALTFWSAKLTHPLSARLLNGRS